ncbi:hypothetical protein H2203_000967 [Taxawa tesnikishii (nom. ined.)]|nr:hypothetical protein H2203_000967 [Dothideales sp. JES 119]
MPLTSHLLSSSPHSFSLATQHSFLKRAGSGTLPASTLTSWLIQDRLYALSYVAFIGSLLAKAQLSAQSDRTSTIEWKIVDLLIDALVNIRREVGMFEDILREHFDWGKGGEGDKVDEARPETTVYQNLFKAAAAPDKDLLVGMTVLWATEKCYLEAWRHAKAQSPVKEQEQKTPKVLRDVLIPNWTDPEFEAFVDRIGALTDEFAESYGFTRNERSRELHQCMVAWNQVVWAEEKFWPDVDEEVGN